VGFGDCVAINIWGGESVVVFVLKGNEVVKQYY